MNSFNKFCVVGCVVRDPEMKTLENGSKVANITLAVDRHYLDKDGNKITDFLNFALWNKNAEKICEKGKKGDVIQLEGYNTTKKIETEKGKINTIEPMVESFAFLSHSKKTDNETTNIVEEELEK